MARYTYRTQHIFSSSYSFEYSYVCEKCGKEVTKVQKELLSSSEYQSAGKPEDLVLPKERQEFHELAAHSSALASLQKNIKRYNKGDYLFITDKDCLHCKAPQSWGFTTKHAVLFMIGGILAGCATVLLEYLFITGDMTDIGEVWRWIFILITLLFGGLFAFALISQSIYEQKCIKGFKTSTMHHKPFVKFPSESEIR